MQREGRREGERETGRVGSVTCPSWSKARGSGRTIPGKQNSVVPAYSGLLSVAVMKHSNPKQLKEEKVYFRGK